MRPHFARRCDEAGGCFFAQKARAPKHIARGSFVNYIVVRFRGSDYNSPKGTVFVSTRAGIPPKKRHVGGSREQLVRMLGEFLVYRSAARRRAGARTDNGDEPAG